ncbi:hypothetical protein CCACVL1_01340, partial [Corchorus capsularis]
LGRKQFKRKALWFAKSKPIQNSTKVPKTRITSVLNERKTYTVD